MSADTKPADILGQSLPLGKVFSSDYLFSIPSYQRPYAWTTEEAEVLLDDLLGFLGDDPPAKIAALKPYFLGSIVLIKEKNAPDADVIDGQQRLTTLTLLFAVLRELAETQKERAELAPFVYEAGSFTLGTASQPRLTLRSRDADFFHRHVQQPGGLDALTAAEPANDAQENLRSNALLLRDRLAALPPDRRKALAAYLAQRCYLVVVSTSDRASAYRIFSVLNDRGLDLTATDILKAEIIGTLADAPADEAAYTERWEQLEEDLGRDRFLELFGHIRTVYRKVKRKEALLDEVKTFVRPAERPKAFIDDELEPYARVFLQAREAAFGAVVDQTDPVVRAINRSLGWLGRVDNADWVPVAMVLLRHFASDRARLAAALGRLERLASAMMVYRGNLNVRIDRYAAVLSHLEGGRVDGETPRWDGDPLAAEAPLDLRPEEHGWILDQLDGDLYSVTRIRLFVLLRLNDALTDGSNTYHPPIITVEHVLPQNPKAGGEWTEWFPDEETRKAYVHKLGNLALLSRQRNSSARNFPFDEKKAKYFESAGSSAFVLTAHVLGETEWTPEVIEDRQARYLRALAQAWDLDLELWREGALTVAEDAQTRVRGYLARSGPHLRTLFDRLGERLLALGGDVERVENDRYFAFKRNGSTGSGGAAKNVACVKVQPATSTVVATLRVDPDTVALREGFTRDLRGVGSHGTGDLELRIRTDDDLHAAADLLQQSYDNAA